MGNWKIFMEIYLRIKKIEIRLKQYFNFVVGKFYIVLMYKEDKIDLLKGLSDGRKRLPDDLAQEISKGVLKNSRFPAGKKILFRTDAEKMDFYVLFRRRNILHTMSDSATSGIDVYYELDNETISYKCITPKMNTQMYVFEHIELVAGIKEVFMYLPAFAEIDTLILRCHNSKYIEFVLPKNQLAVAVYGSSITQGCAASRPSLSYTNLLSKYLNCKFFNFGFSESAKGEEKLIKYIAALKVDVFIIEYDHNASIEKLRKTHKNVYKTIRKYSNCFIIFLSRMSGGISISLSEEKERNIIIKDTLYYAESSGDKNVALIDGSKVLPKEKFDFFVDDRHLNDVGMRMLAEEILKIMKERGIVK